MANKLVIVESPAKARSIGKMLGSDYVILASMGHIRDLPEKSFGVDIAHDFQPVYTDTPRSKKVVKELTSAAKKASEIYLASDPDREGEAISWHLHEVLSKNFKGEFHRVTFHEITRNAIAKAFENAGSINMDLVDAQQARRVLDRIVGYMVSPLLWSHVERGISAGRVQSVALRLVVEREREILNFQPEEYWNFMARFSVNEGRAFESRLFKINGGNFTIANAEAANQAKNAIINGSPFLVNNINSQDKRRHAQPPFTTSTMQQAANNLLRMSASETMRLAQELYEGVEVKGTPVGLITYMRTDSVTVAREAQLGCLDFIRENYGAEYAPEKPNYYKNKSAAQEAHEAIRPTDIRRTPESMKGILDGSLLKLYTLIWKRFVASQMTPAIQRQLAIDINTTGSDRNVYTFRANAGITVFPGYTTIYNDNPNSEEKLEDLQLLAALRKGDTAKLLELLNEQKFTEPPARFTEATLIKELEENGIGRPSTYATIISTIINRKYVAKQQGKLTPTELGCRVVDFLIQALNELFAVGFTSKMEEELDDVEAGKIQWTKMLGEFYEKFVQWMGNAKMIGAPTETAANELIELFTDIEWAEPVKFGRRVYDDKKFYDSITEQMRENHQITAKQYDALTNMAAKYFAQISHKVTNPELKEVLADLAQSYSENTARQQEAAEAVKAMGGYDAIFDAFAEVKWEEAQKRRGRSFDDEKFFKSLKKQADAGKTLSDKQLDSLRKMALKYQESIKDFDTLKKRLNIVDAATAGGDSENGAATAAVKVDLSDEFDFLSKVTDWAEPVKRGRRTYDDKEFYNSLRQQYEGGKVLSDKQVAALRKLVTKYQGK